MKKHFRYNRLTRHYAYIVGENNKCYLYVSITHAPRTLGISNIKLKSSNTYVVPQINILEKDLFSKHESPSKFKRCDGPILKMVYKKTKFIELKGNK